MNGFRLLESVTFDEEAKDHQFSQYVTPIVGVWYESNQVLGQVHAYRINMGAILEDGGHNLLKSVLDQDEELLSLYYMITDSSTEGYDFWYPSIAAKNQLPGFDTPEWQITYIKLLKVDNDFRGKKLGHRIMSELEKGLENTNSILLHSCPQEGPVAQENIIGLNRYYERMGFTELEPCSDLMIKTRNELIYKVETESLLTA